MMNQVELLTNLKRLKKPFYTFGDLELILGLSKLSANKRIIDLINQGFLIKLSKNTFVPSIFELDIMHIASQLYQPSYLSFESALSYHGVIKYDVDILTFATLVKSLTREIGTTSAVWTKIRKEQFFGFTNKKGIMIASPEKALCDLIYMVSIGKAKLEKSDIDLKSLDADLLKKYILAFPLRTQNVFEKVLQIKLN